ncbi:MAG TPA: hypothetical protein VH186_35660 [Chloroflexia bacterium]|nr:hypothetical protein [Chloroflexia bacterium]
MDPFVPDSGTTTGRPLLYLGTAQGIHLLEMDYVTKEWTSRGYGLAGQDISALAWDNRAPGLVLAGTAAGDLFISFNYGMDWEEARIAFPGQKIWSITPDSHHPPGAFYLGLDGGYLFYTSDQGQSACELTCLHALPEAKYWFGPFGAAIFHSIIVVEKMPGLLYLGLSVVGILASIDSGQHWQDVTANIPRVPHPTPEGPQLADIHKLALHPLDPTRLYATTHYGTFRSDDGAKSWENITTGLPFEMTRPLALHPLDPDTVYVIAHDSGSDTDLPMIRGPLLVHRSRDGGRQWEALGRGLPAEANCAVLREAFISQGGETCNLYLGTNQGQVFASYNEGDDWQPVVNLGASIRVVRVLA